MPKIENEEDRVERIIRALLKLPENKRCINCNALGPQYVCTTFSTFVCTNCSGIHREFSHRVKSVSMARFNAEEVSALQAGGNERARQLFFKEWDPHRFNNLNGSNLYKLRDLIKHVYVDRKFTGESSNEKLRMRLRDKEDSKDNSKVSMYRGGSQSPSNGDNRNKLNERSAPCGINDAKTFKYYYEERSSPRYMQENSRQGSSRKHPANFEIVDDRFRDDDSQSGRLSRLSHRESGIARRSMDHQNSIVRTSSPVVHPLKHILGEDVMPLQVGGNSKVIARKEKISDENKASASTSNKTSTPKNTEQKNQTLDGFIDVNKESKSLVPASGPELENHRSSCTHPSQESSTPMAPKPNTVEFLLFELSSPSVKPAENVYEVPRNHNSLESSPGGNFLTHGGHSATTSPVTILPSPNSSSGYTTPRGSKPNSYVSPASPLGQILALANSSNVAETASVTNSTSLQVSSASLTRQVSTLSKNSSPSVTVFSENMFSNGGSSAPPTRRLVSCSSASASVASSGSMPVGGVPAAAPMWHNFDPTSIPSTTNFPAQISNCHPQAAPNTCGDLTSKITNNQQLTQMKQTQASVLSAADGTPGQQNAARFGAPNNQLLRPVNNLDGQETSSANVKEPSQDVLKLAQDVGVQPKPQSNSTGRQALPEDLFAASFVPIPGNVPGWRTAPPPYYTGQDLQYHPSPMPVLAYASQAKSTNPFEINNGMVPVQAQQFSSMENLRGVLPDFSAPGMPLPTSGINSITLGWMTPQPPLHASSATPSASGGYLGQLHMNMPLPRPQGASGFGSDEAFPFNLFNSSQQPTSGYSSIQATPNTFPAKEGNPFG